VEYRALIRSELKQKILISLLRGDKKLSDLKTDINSTETTILHALKEFEKLDLTTKNAGVYSLSPLGRIEAQLCDACFGATEMMEKFKVFWLTHDIHQIPSGSLLKLGMLQAATVVKSERSELAKVHDNFLKMVSNTKKVTGVSPIFHPDFVSLFQDVLNVGGAVDLIVTEEVFSKTFEFAISTGTGELFHKFMGEGRLNLYLLDDIKIALTVTESSLSMGLFHLDGQYDYSMDLVSTDPQALEWGKEVFQSFLKRAKKVSL
jgi:predicted transcriptional regulator